MNGTITWPKNMEGYKMNLNLPDKTWEEIKVEEERQRKRKREKSCTRLNSHHKKESTYRKEYVVERIVDYKYEHHSNIYFEVKWRGYSKSLNTWEPLEHLTNCPEPLVEFLYDKLNESVLEKLCDLCGTPKHLSNQALLDLLPSLNWHKLPSLLGVLIDLFKLSLKPPRENHIHKIERGRKSLIIYQFLLKREEQEAKLKHWEYTINEMSTDSAPIKVENLVDLEVPPDDFNYINEYVSGSLVIPVTPVAGCECVECGPRIKSCCGKQDHGGFTYTPHRKINVNPGTAIYECNSQCKCGPDCRNRVVQKGRKVPLCIYRTSNGCGWGVKAVRKIHCGEFVCEYVGEVISHEEAEERGKAYDAEGRTYLFDLDYNSRDNPYTVDAAKYGNVSHFINHSCDPNLAVYAVWIDCMDPNLPKLALFAIREIEKDEQLTFDYMMVPDSPRKTPDKPKLETPDKDGEVQLGRSVCKCDADSCRRYLF